MNQHCSLERARQGLQLVVKQVKEQSHNKWQERGGQGPTFMLLAYSPAVSILHPRDLPKWGQGWRLPRAPGVVGSRAAAGESI